jgi:transforming growth factor-beta-induced protein
MKKLLVLVTTTLLTLATFSSNAQSNARSNTGMPIQNIAEIAVASGNFKTLVAALTAADLAKTVAGPGPLTVFAPTDAAFAKLPSGTVEALLKDLPTLSKILTYHVVPGLKSVNDLLKARTVTTLQGNKVTVQVYQNRLFINKSQVIVKPILATNGIIYVIDTVLMP